MMREWKEPLEFCCEQLGLKRTQALREAIAKMPDIGAADALKLWVVQNVAQCTRMATLSNLQRHGAEILSQFLNPEMEKTDG
ncbi:MAG: hypothetical protein AAFW60_02855 [Pseudomonadota bacterium]